MDNKPLLSIVVPTKDRYFYLKYLIRLIKSFDSDKIELVIQDNTDNNQDILDFVEQCKWDGLSYNYYKGQIPVSENSDRAILSSKGEYVCFLGDDDGVFADIAEVAEMMKNKGIDALIPSRVIYNWPDYKDSSYYDLEATLQMKDVDNSIIPIDPVKELKRSAKSGFKNMYMMPRVYQAIVRRSTLDSVYNKYGSFFPGGSPDMANAVALSLENCKCCYYSHHVTITGQCRSVGGGEKLMTKLKDISEISFLSQEQSLFWHDSLPKLWCSDTIWPMSAYCVLKKSGRNDLLKQINWNEAVARFVFNHRGYKKTVHTNILTYYYIISILIDKGYNFIGNRLLYKFSKGKKLKSGLLFRNIDNIIMCLDYN